MTTNQDAKGGVLWVVLAMMALLLGLLTGGCALGKPNEQMIIYSEKDGEYSLTQYAKTYWGGGSQQDVTVDLQQEDEDSWSLFIEMKGAHDPEAQKTISEKFFDLIKNLGMVVGGWLMGGGGG